MEFKRTKPTKRPAAINLVANTQRPPTPTPSTSSVSPRPSPTDTPVSNKSVGQKKHLILSGLVVTLLAVILVFFYYSENNPSSSLQSPSHETILPAAKSIDELGGWKRVSPPENEPVFAYSDAVDGVAITVSQQPLPASFRSNITEHVASLAKSYNATRKLDAANTPFYIGASSDGPQSVIFTKHNLLILIKSQDVITDASWTSYIQSLN